MRMLQLWILLVPAIVGGSLAAHVWNLPTELRMLVGLPPALVLIVWAGLASQ